MSQKFYPLLVKKKTKTTSDCVVVTFDIKEEVKEHFSYKQGQYLTLQKDIGGEEVRRSYSLCSTPLDDEWEVAIKKVEDGRFSTYANDVLQVGDTIDVMPPEGKFYVDIDADRQRNYVAFAAGSGITPIISIIETHLRSEPKSTFKLFYVNQTVSTVILKEELEALKNSYLDRFEIFYFLTRQQRNIPFLNGRLDLAKLDIIFKSICDVDHIDHYFSCGPESMVVMIDDFLTKTGVPKSAIHFELFGNTAVDTKKQDRIKKVHGHKDCELSIIEGGQRTEFVIGQGGNNILDAAMNNSVDLPYACKGGVCCTCRAKLVEGKVEMLVSYGLDEQEIKDGFILTCQAIPISSKIVVDFDI